MQFMNHIYKIDWVYEMFNTFELSKKKQTFL